MATLPVSYVVAVDVQMSPIAAALRNFGAMMIVGSSDIINIAERIRSYGTAEEVAADFGTQTPEYKAALVYFSQSPRPRLLQIARWAKSSVSGRLIGLTLSESQRDIAVFKGVTNGGFSVQIDGSQVVLSDIDLSQAETLDAVAAVIDSALARNGSCVWNGDAFEIRSASSGQTSAVSEPSATELSTMMGLTGGTAVPGSSAESLPECMAILMGFNSWYGAFVCGEITDADALEVSGMIEAATPSRIIGYTSQSTGELSAGPSNSLGAKLAAKNYKRSFVMYSSASEYAAVSVLGRMATVNFQGSNTAITLKFKQCPGVEAERLVTAQARALRANNVNVFAAYQNDTAILQEGTVANGYFIDEIHGLDWLQNQIETDVWNLLYTSTTKVGQDEAGANTLVTTVSGALERGVTNGLIAPGVWNGDDFGALHKGDTLATGYYVYIQPMDEQAQSDREARKAPPVQVAVKLRGAIHFVDVMITVNR